MIGESYKLSKLNNEAIYLSKGGRYGFILIHYYIKNNGNIGGCFINEL